MTKILRNRKRRTLMRLAASFGCLTYSGIHYRIDNLNNRFFVHHFRIYKRSDIDSRFRKYMRLAYDVGERRHIQGKKVKPLSGGS
jgi:hypothetical protein